MKNTQGTSAKRKWWKYILILVLVFIIAGGVGAYLGNALINKDRDPADANKIVAANRANIMIMGVDTRKEDVGRSDTLMLATVDPENDKVSLFSIPRDTRVKIDGFGYDKINAAYAYGGRELTQKTVESLLDTKVDHYVVINLQGFVKIIDALGGVDIDVEKRMKYDDPYDDNGGLHINLYPGMQHMDGKTAVTYVRYRDEEGDIGRIRRQQKFMKAVMEKVLSPGVITKLPSIVSALHDSIKTDMSVSEIISFVMTVKDAKDKGFNAQMLPGKPAYIEGISYWLPEVRKAREMLATDLGVKVTDEISSNLEKADQEYQDSIPADVVEMTSEQRAKEQIATDRKEAKEDAESRKAKQSEEEATTDKDSSDSKASKTTKKATTKSGTSSESSSTKKSAEDKGKQVPPATESRPTRTMVDDSGKGAN